MLMFYHGIGLLLMFAGISIVQKVISNYEEPSLPHYLALVLSAGPTEESLFFGIPYYASVSYTHLTLPTKRIV